MRVLHLASFDRWSGAVDPAFHETAALRAGGIEAFFGYVGGYKLERKLKEISWALPILERGHGFVPTLKSVAAIRRTIAAHRIDVIHAHLSWDHQLAMFAKSRGVRLVRTYHAARSIRSHLLRRTDSLAVVNSSLLAHPLFRGRDVTWTPATLDHERFQPDGDRASLPRPCLGCIGKLSPRRGFEDALRAAARIDGASLAVIGHGAHQAQLEELSRQLGIDGRVIFAGYHEDDLPEYYRALDILLFAGQGSDEGHRAVVEAMATGVPVAAYPFPGMEAVIGDRLADRFIARSPDPASLAECATALLGQRESLRADCVEATRRFAFGPAAERLVRLYDRALSKE